MEDPAGAATGPIAGKGAPARVFYGWWVVIAGLLANFAYAEQFNSSYGVFLNALSFEMGWGRTAIAAVQSVSRIPEAFVAPFLGGYVDRHGPRWLVGGGAVIVGGAFMALATAQELFQIYLYKGLVMPIGSICLGGFLGVTVSNWFVAQRGRALGILSMGSSLGTMVMPVLAALMIESWGWRWAWFAMGPMVVVLAMPAVLLLRRRPEDVGLRPDGAPPGQVVPRVEEVRARRREQLLAADFPWARMQVLRTPTLWIIVFAWGFAGLGVTGTNLHLVPYIEGLGYPLTLAAAAVSLRAATALVGAPIWGIALERMPITAAASAQFVCQAAAMLAFLLYPTPAGVIVGLLLYGVGTAGSGVVQETIWANYFGRISLGLVRSVVFPLQAVATASGPLVVGLVSDLSGGYGSAWLLLAFGFLVAAVVMQWARPPRPSTSPGEVSPVA